jgi:hypothetical protein
MINTLEDFNADVQKEVDELTLLYKQAQEIYPKIIDAKFPILQKMYTTVGSTLSIPDYDDPKDLLIALQEWLNTEPVGVADLNYSLRISATEYDGFAEVNQCEYEMSYTIINPDFMDQVHDIAKKHIKTKLERQIGSMQIDYAILTLFLDGSITLEQLTKITNKDWRV